MSFVVSPEAYARFMGRFSQPLATQFAGQAELRHGERALDVGCGPGALTTVLVDRLGADAVSAIDPSEPFVTALGVRLPDVDVRLGEAEHLPFADGDFAATFAQLVVHFMRDPVAGLREMARVTSAGGVVAACVWDHGSGKGPLSTFWQAVKDLDPDAHDESDLAGSREGHLVELFDAAGLSDIVQSTLTVRVTYATLAEWWEPYTLGVGPAGSYVAQLSTEHQQELQQRCARLLPSPPFEIEASAWSVNARP